MQTTARSVDSRGHCNTTQTLERHAGTQLTARLRLTVDAAALVVSFACGLGTLTWAGAPRRSRARLLLKFFSGKFS